MTQTVTQSVASGDRVLAWLIDELMQRLAEGRSDELPDFFAEHAEHAAQLQQLMPALEALVQIRNATQCSRLAPRDEAFPLPPVDQDSPWRGEDRARGINDESQTNNTTLGDFRIIREIGRGGMGIVYEAEQLSLSRRVALKILPFAAVLDPRHLQRFKNEAIAAAQLAHPHIVDVHGVGCERGVHFYAMRLIDGETLAAVIEGMKGEGLSTKDEEARSHAPRGNAALAAPRRDVNVVGTLRVPSPHTECAVYNDTIAALTTLRSAKPRDFFRRVAELGIQAAEALDHAHQMGIVHRDIKPSNLMLDQLGKLWITDFGLARLPSDAGMTMTGDLVGTLRYMSPEQAEGKSAILDHRSDIYSLGVTLYELLTLRPAFPGTDRQTLLRQIASEEPTPPRKLSPAVPTELETILLKAIAKDPAERYVTAKKLAEDLGRFRDQKAIKAKPPTVWQRVNKLVRRHRAVAAWALLALILTTLGLAVSTALILRERADVIAARDDESIARNDADQERKRAEANYLTARQAVGQMLKQVADVRLDAIREMKDVRRKLLEDAVDFYTKLIAVSPRDAQAYAERADVQRLLGKFAEATQDFELAAKLDPENAASRLALAELYLANHAGQLDGELALMHANRAVQIDRRNPVAHWWQAAALRHEGRIDGARQALRMFEQVAPSNAHTYHRLAWAYLAIDQELALRYGRRAVEIDPLDHDAQGALGAILHITGQTDEALRVLNEAYRLNPYPNSRLGHGIVSRRADLLAANGEYAEAVDSYTHTLEIEPWSYLTYMRRAAAHFHLQNYDEALADVAKAFEMHPGTMTFSPYEGPLTNLETGTMALAAWLRTVKTPSAKRTPRGESRVPSSNPTTRKLGMERLEARLALSGFGLEDGAYIVEDIDGLYNDVQVQPGDQAIVAAGLFANPRRAVGIARYDSQGRVDSSYGNGGFSNPLLGPAQIAFDLVIQPDGKAVVAGEVFSSTNVGVFTILAVARLNSDGSPDASFSGDGWVSVDIPQGSLEQGIAVALQSSGKVVVAGTASPSALVARFTASGELDSGTGGFGQQQKGYTLTSFGGQIQPYTDVAVQPDDKLVAVAAISLFDGTQRLSVARYTATGALDATFNGTGYNILSLAGINSLHASGVALQSDGKIVVVGVSSGVDGAGDMFIARFNVDGKLDATFGGGTGYVRLDIDGGASVTNESARDVAIQPDGKIVVVGTESLSGAGEIGNVLVARFNVDGTPDLSFGGSGFKLGPPKPGSDHYVLIGNAVALQSDGSIIVAGWDNNNAGSSHPLLMRFYAGAPPGPVIRGGDGDDAFRIIRSADELLVYHNVAPTGEPTERISLTGLSVVTIDGGGGDDSLIVDTTGHPSLGVDRLVYTAGSGVNSLTLQGGAAQIDSTAVGGSFSTTVTAGAHLSTSHLQQNALTVAAASRVTLLPGGASANVLTALELGANGTLDLADNDLVVKTIPATKIEVFNSLYTRLASGFAAGAWNGTGLVSSSAQGNAHTTLSMVDNAIFGLTAFNGEPVDANSILFKYTYYGDIDQDGAVGADDLTVFANNFGRSSGATQVDGDIDFNGTVDADDLTVFAANFGRGIGAPLAASGPQALLVLSERTAAKLHLADKLTDSALIDLLAEAVTTDIETLPAETFPVARRHRASSVLWSTALLKWQV